MSHRQRTPPLCRQRYRSPAQPIRPPKPSSFPHKLIASCQHPNSAVKPRPPRRLSLSFLLKPSATLETSPRPLLPSSSYSSSPCFSSPLCARPATAVTTLRRWPTPSLRSHHHSQNTTPNLSFQLANLLLT
ncbi:hypothetical protein S245_046609 [Arachis hypogaea]